MASNFNPVKEEEEGKRAHRMIWSTKAIEAALKGIEQGRKLIANPFYEGDTRLLKADLVFERTPEEKAEFKRCMNDILYFANKYCKLMTPEGIKPIVLRDYQRDYLKQLSKNQMNIMLSARQAGKCNSLITNVLVKIDDDLFNLLGVKLKKYWLDNYYIEKLNVFQIPLFEIYNLCDKSICWKIKYYLYKILFKLV